MAGNVRFPPVSRKEYNKGGGAERGKEGETAFKHDMLGPKLKLS